MLGNIYFDPVDPESIPPKDKFFIVVGIDSDQFGFATVYINKKINVFEINSDELVKLQVEIQPKGVYSFLKENSFIDCSRIKQRLFATFNPRVKEKHIVLKGTLGSEELKNLQQILRASDSIPSYFLKLYNI